MWQVVCVGPGPEDKVRRVVDRGPLHPDKTRADSIAEWLKKTGLYETVTVVASGAILNAASVAKG